MPTLRKPKKSDPPIHAFGEVEHVVEALDQAARTVAQAEQTETEALTVERRAVEGVSFNRRAVALGHVPESAIVKAQRDAEKAQRQREQAVAAADAARDTLRSLESHHSVSIDEARALASEHYRSDVTQARQRLCDALLAAADASDQLRAALDQADLLGVRGLPGGRGWAGPWAEFDRPAKPSNGPRVIGSSPLIEWLRQAERCGCQVPQTYTAATRDSGRRLVRQSELRS